MKGDKTVHFDQPPKLNHFHKLIDRHGIYQHARLSEPDPAYGYSLDDNARALIVAALLHKHQPNKAYRELIEKTLTFIEGQKAGGGEFRNYGYITETGEFLSREVASDGLGEVVWACGYLVYLDKKTRFYSRAKSLIDYGIQGLREDQGLRQASYALAGLAYIDQVESGSYKKTGQLLKNRLLCHYQQHASTEWRWFENWLVYANAILPWGLMVYSRLEGNKNARRVGLEALDFLLSQTMLDHLPIPIGQKQWYERGRVRSIFDQQPIEAGYMVLACLEAARITGDRKYHRFALDWFDWFRGNNIENLSLIDEQDGGCYDGLQPWSVNQNKGAESTLCYLIAHLVLSAYEKRWRCW